MSAIKIVFTLPFILNLAAAGEKPPLTPGEVRSYEVRGVVEDLMPEVPAAVIYHEEIPGFLDAMSVTLRARDAKELAGLKVGDGITFRLNVTTDYGWIDQVHVVAPGKDPAAEKEWQ